MGCSGMNRGRHTTGRTARIALRAHTHRKLVDWEMLPNSPPPPSSPSSSLNESRETVFSFFFRFIGGCVAGVAPTPLSSPSSFKPPPLRPPSPPFPHSLPSGPPAAASLRCKLCVSLLLARRIFPSLGDVELLWRRAGSLFGRPLPSRLYFSSHFSVFDRFPCAASRPR
jgi:hypothetical protein